MTESTRPHCLRRRYTAVAATASAAEITDGSGTVTPDKPTVASASSKLGPVGFTPPPNPMGAKKNH